VILAIERLAAKCRTAIAALNGGLVDTLEGSLIRDGHEFKRVPAGKWVWDHDRIARQVALEAASVNEHGEVPTAHRAAAEAARMMRQIYASDSTPAKKGKLQSFGLDPDDLRDFVGEGTFKISKTPTTTPERKHEPE
jgi:hypothetical protein